MSLKRNGILCLIGGVGLFFPATAARGEGCSSVVWESRIDLAAENEAVPGFAGDLKRAAAQERPCVRVKGRKALFVIQQYLGAKNLEDMRLSFAFRFQTEKTAFHLLLRENGRRNKDDGDFQHYALSVLRDSIHLKEVRSEQQKKKPGASSSASSEAEATLEKSFSLPAPLEENQWHEFSVLIEKNHLRIFLDGKEMGDAFLKDSGGSFQLTQLEGEADYADIRLSEPNPVPDQLKREETK